MLLRLNVCILIGFIGFRLYLYHILTLLHNTKTRSCFCYVPYVNWSLIHLVCTRDTKETYRTQGYMLGSGLKVTGHVPGVDLYP